MAKRLLSFADPGQGVNVSAVTSPLGLGACPAGRRAPAADRRRRRVRRARLPGHHHPRHRVPRGDEPGGALRALPVQGAPALRDQPLRPPAALAVLRDADSGSSAADRLRSMVAAFTAWHAEHHTIARVVQYELAALAPEHLSEVAVIRRAISAEIEQVLADGVAGRLVRRDRPARYDARRTLALDRRRSVVHPAPRRPGGIGQAVRRPRPSHGPGIERPRTSWGLRGAFRTDQTWRAAWTSRWMSTLSPISSLPPSSGTLKSMPQSLRLIRRRPRSR